MRHGEATNEGAKFVDAQTLGVLSGPADPGFHGGTERAGRSAGGARGGPASSTCGEAEIIQTTDNGDVSVFYQWSSTLVDIYENIIVGNFLFGLGVKLGMQHHVFPIEPVSVNLLQQQRLDERLGDVMIANAQLIRLIEFKRASNKSRKEIGKWRLISDALKMKGFSELYGISRKVHWYVKSDFRKKNSLGEDSRIEVHSYLDFPDPKFPIEITDFIDKTAKESNEKVIDNKEISWCRMYIDMIAGLFGDTSGMSGCLLLTVTGSGQLAYVAVDDIGDLIKTPQLVLEESLERQVQLVREQGLEREQIERTRERKIGREGPSLGY